MRIWSLHPKYLDSKGLVALWRETLLAKHVLEGKTRGYKNHPQLDRFKATSHPVDFINKYLSFILIESVERGYHFDGDKIGSFDKASYINVTTGQLKYEHNHLLSKLNVRDISRYEEFKLVVDPLTHPLFKIIDGEIEPWEIV